jgi:hypothetical protein
MTANRVLVEDGRTELHAAEQRRLVTHFEGVDRFLEWRDLASALQAPEGLCNPLGRVRWQNAQTAGMADRSSE